MAKGEKPIVDFQICMACGVCVQSCPFSCLDLNRMGIDKYKKAYPELIKSDKCTGCGICQTSCPVDCIKMS